jgi:hypothetical protein
MFVVAAAAVALPIFLRRQRWPRVVAVTVLLGMAGFVWAGVLASARLAVEMAGITSWHPDDPFIKGALAAGRIVLDLQLPFWLSVLGLAVLSLLPLRARS